MQAMQRLPVVSGDGCWLGQASWMTWGLPPLGSGLGQHWTAQRCSFAYMCASRLLVQTCRVRSCLMCTPWGPQLGYQQKVSPTPSPQAEALMAVLLEAATSRLLVKGTSHRIMLSDKAAQGKGCSFSRTCYVLSCLLFPCRHSTSGPWSWSQVQQTAWSMCLGQLTGRRDAALGRQVLPHTQAAPGTPAGSHHWAPGHGWLDPRCTHHTGGPQPGRRHGQRATRFRLQQPARGWQDSPRALPGA